jgi:hypothetical protein
MNTAERRSEPRIAAGVAVVLTPLASVATRLRGSVVNVSARGVKVHFEANLEKLPRAGTVYRIQSRGDLILGEVRYSTVADAGADLGLHIIHWGDAGELKRLVENHQPAAAR